MQGLDQFIRRSLLLPPRLPAVADSAGLAAASPRLLIAPSAPRVELDWLDGEGLGNGGTRYSIRDRFEEEEATGAGGVDQAALDLALSELAGLNGATLVIQGAAPYGNGDIVDHTPLPSGWSFGVTPGPSVVPDHDTFIAYTKVSGSSNFLVQFMSTGSTLTQPAQVFDVVFGWLSAGDALYFRTPNVGTQAVWVCPFPAAEVGA